MTSARPDLTIEFHRGEGTQGLGARLAQLYQSSYATWEYFRVYESAGDEPYSATVSDHDSVRQLLVYGLAGRDLFVWNKLFSISSAEAEQFCQAAFREHPEVRRIHFSTVVGNAAAEVDQACISGTSEDYRLSLPASLEAYRGSLGKNLRKQLAYYENRLKKDFADYKFDLLEGSAISDSDVHQVVQMNRARMVYKGRRSGIDHSYERKIQEFSQFYGFLGKLSLGDRMVAGVLCYRVGTHFYMHIISHDPQYNDYRCGKLCLYLTIGESIARAGTDFHMLWGSNEYKDKFGCARTALSSFIVFREGLEYQVFRIWNGTKAGLRSLVQRVVSGLKALIKIVLFWNLWKNKIRRKPSLED